MLYPFKFIPQLQEVIWGGQEFLAKIKSGKGVRITSDKLYGDSLTIPFRKLQDFCCCKKI